MIEVSRLEEDIVAQLKLIFASRDRTLYLSKRDLKKRSSWIIEDEMRLSLYVN